MRRQDYVCRPDQAQRRSGNGQTPDGTALRLVRPTQNRALKLTIALRATLRDTVALHVRREGVPTIFSTIRFLSNGVDLRNSNGERGT